ncbi:MAG: adenylyl-sulfate reductase subunit alpha [Chitinispirillales bacterium]|jgi:adenylylsulfate reductase subunit A|nr:adenylyl-sulfate reductase subunit alpha [Chitinispirillales bacterium]
MMNLDLRRIDTDFLITGGGTAGCLAAIAFRERSDARVLIAEKADIRRSGCLAAGVNALNAFIAPGKKPRDYVDYARYDAEGIVRGDLLLTMAEGLNSAVEKLEKLGLTILKDKEGRYAARGWRNVKINGENIKPLLAGAVSARENITVLNRANVFEYIVKDNRILGAYAIDVDKPVLYVISAKAALCAAGGASGLYKPNHPGNSRHKMWYPPFNTGAGLSMGIRAGAEMTTLEMRFIALRCKDTIAPVGTLAQGVGAKQINSLGEVYEDRYGLTTSRRLHGTVMEILSGRGPCRLKTTGITKEQETDLLKAYLNMAPSQSLRWLESGLPPGVRDVEIEGTEPCVTGGHTAAGYWVDTSRETTVRGLFAAGDAAGGCPQKYVTGAAVEGEIAADSAVKYMNEKTSALNTDDAEAVKRRLEGCLSGKNRYFSVDDLEEEMQAAMDRYAGGIGEAYRFSAASLKIADDKIHEIETRSDRLSANDMQELVYILELKERLTLCKSLIAHLSARKETRWRGFAERTDFPDKSDKWECYVNSRLENGKINVITRPLIREDEIYEH